MGKRTATLIVLAALAPIAAGVAFATPSLGLTSELLARGNAGEFRIKDKSMGLKIRAAQPTDLAFVKATLAKDGYTGWHGHPGPSLVIVKSGMLTMYRPDRRGDDDTGYRHRRRGCIAQAFGPGQAFVHPEDVHNFVNTGDGPVEFFVAYFVPAGAAPLLRDEGVPPECA